MTNFSFIKSSIEMPFKDFSILDNFSQQTLSIKIIWFLTAFFLTLFIVFFCILIFSRVYKNIQKRRRKRIIENLTLPISTYLFDDEMETALKNLEYKKIRGLFQKRFKKGNSFSRNILRKEILILHSSYSGEIAYKLQQLFIIFGFHKEVGKRLKSQTWNIKAHAINDAAEMNLTQYAGYILNLINNPNSIIRTEARVASVRFNKKNPFHFFQTLKNNMSDWDQIKIHNALLQYQNMEIPSMGKWLDFKNESVVVFSLKIIGFYNQLEELEKVIDCLKKPSFKIKLQALKTLAELNMEQSVPVLLDFLKTENIDKKLLIQTLNSLAQIGLTNHSIGAINDCLEIDDHDIAFAASIALKTGKNGLCLLKAKALTSDEKKARIINHAIYCTS